MEEQVELDETFDIEWAKQFKEIEKEYDVFYKEKINQITIFYLYVNNNILEKVSKEYYDLQKENFMPKEELIKIIQDHKINNTIKYSLSNILKFNIDLEPVKITDFVSSNNFEEYFSKLKSIDDINWKDSINMFENLNSLIFVYTKKIISQSNTKRIFFKKNNNTRKKH